MSKAPSTKRRDAHQRGIAAEKLAVNYLRLKGYEILKERYKTPVGEIDVLARKGSMLVIVEVKNRASHGAALEAVHHKNRERITQATEYFLMENPDMAGLDIRFDVITLGKGFSLRHLDNAWMIGT